MTQKPVTVLLCLSLMGVAACGEEEVADAPVVIKKKVEAAPTEALEEKKAEDQSYSYEVLVNGQMRRDPFKTYYEDLIVDDSSQIDTSKLTELQKVDLDKLKLVAVVVGTATPMAMVEDSTGRGHTLKIGTLVGKRLGQVKHIRRGEIVVQEEFRDYTGKRIPQLKELKLEEGGASP
jgi:Tfp pilus assembly protein PilP